MSTKNGPDNQSSRVIFEILRHVPHTRLAIRHAYRAIQRARYKRKSYNEELDAKLVFFESYGGKSFSCSPKALYLEMLSASCYKDYHFVWSFREDFRPDSFDSIQTMSEAGYERTTVVAHGSEDYYRALMKAGYWILNSRIPEYIEPREKQIYVQCWHGTPLKRLGVDIASNMQGSTLNTPKELAERFCIDAHKWTYLLSPSRAASDRLCSAFKVSDSRREQIVLELGYPRNDAITQIHSDQNAEELMDAIRSRLNIPLDKKILLYAPTMRDDQYSSGKGYTMDLPLNLGELHNELGEEWVVLLRMHYHVKNDSDLSSFEGFVIDVSREQDINELYSVADVLCTDYSSVFFDFAVTKKPFVFFWPDIEHYEQDLHGFYGDPYDLPGKKCTNVLQLAHAVQKASEMLTDPERFKEDLTAYRKFHELYCLHEDGNASQRVLEQVFCPNQEINRFSQIKDGTNGEKIEVQSDQKEEVEQAVTSDFFQFVHPKIRKLHNQNAVQFSSPIIVRNIIEQDVSKFRLFVGSEVFTPKLKLLCTMGKKRLCYLSFVIPIEKALQMPIHNTVTIWIDSPSYKNLKYAVRYIFQLKKYIAARTRFIALDNGLTVYFRQNIGKGTIFTIRHSNVTDRLPARAKLLLAWAIAKFAFWLKPILLFEKNSHHYEESGRVVFERLVDDGVQNAFFVISQELAKSLDINSCYKRRFIHQHSFKHYLYFFRCKMFIGTETIAHGLELRCQNIFVLRKLKSKRLTYVFLQHGVMYMISLNSPERSSFKRSSIKGKFYVVASSKVEAQHFIDYAGFERDEIIVSGLPKFDRSYLNDEADKILIMPTWRIWEFAKMREDPEHTPYMRMVHQIVSAIPEHLRDKVIVAPHPLFNASIFSPESNKKNADYNELLRDVSLLITDYSSIAYDAFYRGSNVIFWWAEKDACMAHYGEGTHLMIDKETAFGPVCNTEPELTDSILNLYDRDQPNKYIQRYRKIVSYEDNKNTDRLIEALVKKCDFTFKVRHQNLGSEMKGEKE